MEIPMMSVGMPVYNGETYIELAIKCVLNQTFGDFEFLISDNASTDQTEVICRDYALKDKRISYIRNSENIGAANNYNQLFYKAKGKYFRWFNADDLCSAKLHEQCINTLEKNPKAVMCYGKTDIIDSEGKLISHYNDNLNLQQDSVVERFSTFLEVVGLTNSIYGLMRKDIVGKTILMGDATFPAADTNFMGELALYGTFIELPETLFFRRMHQNASSWDRKNDAVQQSFWKGKESKFVMPTFKKYNAYLKAIDKSPNSSSEKKALKRIVWRRLVWKRKEVFLEVVQYFRDKFSKKQ